MPQCHFNGNYILTFFHSNPIIVGLTPLFICHKGQRYNTFIRLIRRGSLSKESPTRHHRLEEEQIIYIKVKV